MKKNIEKGDLLKSNPLQGYWVCSIVLSFRPKTEEFNAMSHVGITNAVFTHDFERSEIDESELKIISVKNYEDQLVECIQMYGTKLTKGVECIGQIDTNKYYSSPLQFEIGSGSSGRWPLSGPLSASLGYEAVHEWRAENDRDAWLVDVAAGVKSHEAMLKRLKR